MTKYYIKRKNTNSLKKLLKTLSLLLIIAGLTTTTYVFFPIISWQIYFAPVFASQDISSPIPKNTIINSSTIQNLITNARNTMMGVDYTDARNWFPDYVPSSGRNQKEQTVVPFYNLSIPSLGIENAVVSTIDDDLGKHLINYEGTAVPPQNGNAVIFGHSTLPQLFNPKNYKAIFATLYKINVGDSVYVVVNGVSYEYKIQNITVVNPDNTSVFSQNTDDSYITIITCTPPGTTWKRLVVKAKLIKI